MVTTTHQEHHVEAISHRLYHRLVCCQPGRLRAHLVQTQQVVVSTVRGGSGDEALVWDVYTRSASSLYGMHNSFTPLGHTWNSFICLVFVLFIHHLQNRQTPCHRHFQVLPIPPGVFVLLQRRALPRPIDHGLETQYWCAVGETPMI